MRMLDEIQPVSQGHGGGQALSGHLGTHLFKKGFQPQMDHRGDHCRRLLAGLKAGRLAVPASRRGRARGFSNCCVCVCVLRGRDDVLPSVRELLNPGWKCQKSLNRLVCQVHGC